MLLRFGLRSRRLTLRCSLTLLLLRSRLPLLLLRSCLTLLLLRSRLALLLLRCSLALLLLLNRLALLLLLNRLALLLLLSRLTLLLLWSCLTLLLLLNPLALLLLRSRLTLLGRGLIACLHRRRGSHIAICRKRLPNGHAGWVAMVYVGKLRPVGAGDVLILELCPHRRSVLFMASRQFRGPGAHL
jgi:hypothetical protein